ALAMGCDQAILINDPGLTDADPLVVSQILAAGINKIGEVDLVLFGRGSVDNDTGITGPQVARRLNWPILSLVAAITSLDPEGRTIAVERMLDEGRQLVRSPLPAAVSVVKGINEPRYPSFMGIRKASKAEIPVWSTSDVGLDEAPTPAITWPEVFAPPKVETECEMIEGETSEEVATRLADRLIEEKVI
ncbi:MAG: electron transfer flavoprotein subunit beta/FixA family protein, partial [Anaerolineales bacterium]|nr:electron transfer flavoprotein subunit beta/FixA family protein [Anaerolineales bacterium]